MNDIKIEDILMTSEDIAYITSPIIKPIKVVDYRDKIINEVKNRIYACGKFSISEDFIYITSNNKRGYIHAVAIIHECGEIRFFALETLLPNEPIFRD